jgi:hypothetical protein
MMRENYIRDIGMKLTASSVRSDSSNPTAANLDEQ